MTQYRRKSTEEVTAHQWFKPGDHPDDHGKLDPAVVTKFRHPNQPQHIQCRRCGSEWNVHGWIEPRKVKGQKYWQEGATVCPGDYVVTEQIWTNGHPEYTVISRKSFESIFEPTNKALDPELIKELEERPLIYTAGTWESLSRETQTEIVNASNGRGVLIIPEGMDINWGD